MNEIETEEKPGSAAHEPRQAAFAVIHGEAEGHIGRTRVMVAVGRGLVETDQRSATPAPFPFACIVPVGEMDVDGHGAHDPNAFCEGDG